MLENKKSLLQGIYNLLFKYRLKNSIAGRIVPIVKTIKYTNNLDKHFIKSRLIRSIADELFPYITVEEQQTEEGVTLLVARLDVLKREE